MEATTPAYPTRLSETQWATLAAYFAADSQLGRPRNTHLPAAIKAILYVLRTGSGACCRGSFRLGSLCMATSDPGATRAVGSAFTATYAGGVRLRCKRPQSPWVAIADTQSVPLGCLTHRARGFDGGKWVKGRKRHVLVDSLGLFLAVVVTAAKLTSKGCRLCCAGSSSGEAGSIGCGSSGATGPMGNTCCSSGSWNTSTACWKCWSSPEAVLSEWCPELCSWSAPWPDFPVPAAQPGR